MWQCDWLTFKAPLQCAHDVRGGEVISLRRDGSQEWSTVKSMALEGSHSDKLMVRSNGRVLEVSGNPAKYFQGHNLWGPCDVRMLALDTVYEVCGSLGLDITSGDRAIWDGGGLTLSRVDCTRMYRLPGGEVPRWLNVMAAQTNQGHQRVTNPSAGDVGTVYVGQKSRRVAMKFYSKGHEMHRHPPQPGMPVDRLVEYAQDTLRVELVVRGLKLTDEGLRTSAAWDASTGDTLIDRQLGGLSMLDNVALAADELADLPRKLVPIYAAWKNGHDVYGLYSRPTFYRHRAALLPYGIDIRQVRPHIVAERELYACGAPLRSFLTSPIGPPEWAQGTSMLYEPRWVA